MIKAIYTVKNPESLHGSITCLIYEYDCDKTPVEVIYSDGNSCYPKSIKAAKRFIYRYRKSDKGIRLQFIRLI